MFFLDFGVLDLIDMLLAAFLLYQFYRLIKGTVAINIFIGVVAIYLIWKLVQALQMQLLSEILGQFIGVGVIVLVIVFQQEIRKFLLVLGSTNFTRKHMFFKQLKWLKYDEKKVKIEEIVKASINLSKSFTGAIIVIERKSRLGFYSETGISISGNTSSGLLESIFNKYSPLHDGAVIISSKDIIAARCILPITDKASIPSRFGLRHRAAIGVTEKTDAIALVISEETGRISIAIGNDFIDKIDHDKLDEVLRSNLEF